MGCGGDGSDASDDAQNPTSDAAPGADATPGADAAPGADAVVDAASDAAPEADAAVGVECGTMVCAPEQECCVTDPAGTPQYECIASGDPCGGVSAACDGPEDCGGNACCATLMGMSVSATCDTETECTGGLTLCHTGADCPTLSPNCCALPGTGANVCSNAMCLP
jgi:hypothetical protein